MRKVKMSELCKLPIGTVFSTHAKDSMPCFNPQLFILCERSGGENDFYYLPVHGQFEGTDDFEDDFNANLKLDSGESVAMDANTVYRWGMYDPEELFVVFDNNDVKKIVMVLSSALFALEKQKAELDTVAVEVRELPESDNNYGTLVIVGD
jgi:hypothetical protein